MFYPLMQRNKSTDYITLDDTDFFSFEFSFLTRSAQRTQKFALLRSQIVPR